ncbi:MAG: histidinol dehydrogenase [Thermoleophilaceae bacterium]|nr:histidinol dehydrogenase [Thermoleophilaceae bacterium]
MILLDPTPAQVRGAAPLPEGLVEDTARILAEVENGGDAALERLTVEFDGVEAESLHVPAREIDDALALLPAEVLAGLRTAIANVEQVAAAQLGQPVTVELPEGQRVEIVELPVRRAAAYVPGGRAPYPSSVVMCAVTARAAGVEELAVCAPPGPQGRAHPVILAACALCGVSEVYRVGGAQAIAALAFGTETIEPVDVIVGPGSPWVQEAKRQLAGTHVGIDSVAGPSELVVVLGEGADVELARLDLRAQAEHGEDSLVVAVSAERALLEPLEAEGVVLVQSADPVAFADSLAPEHLQLMGAGVESEAERVTRAGCLFVGRDAGTAFGDYVAGSNHVLPTGGAARFASALGPATFRRRMSRVTLGEEAAARLAPAGASLARAEGFPLHAESMERRCK